MAYNLISLFSAKVLTGFEFEIIAFECSGLNDEAVRTNSKRTNTIVPRNNLVRCTKEGLGFIITR